MKLALAFSLAFVTLTGCSKPTPEEQKKQEADLAAALSAALNAPSAAPSASAPTAAAVPGAIVASCNNKGDGMCTETMGVQGFSADDSCKRLGGIYTNGPTPCPRDGLVGTCALTDSSSGLNDLEYHYKQAGMTEAAMKDLCESVKSGKWASAPKGGPGSKGKK